MRGTVWNPHWTGVDSRKHEKALVATKARQEELTLPMARKMLVAAYPRRPYLEIVSYCRRLLDSCALNTYSSLRSSGILF